LLRPTLPKAPDDKALALVISDGIDPEMPGAWNLTPNEVQLLVAYVRSLGRIAPESVPGDLSRGRDLYARHGCASCHIVAGQGSGYGPELSTIGLRRNAAHLRASLLQPAAALPDGYSFLTLQTAQGRTVQGIRRNEDPFSIQLQDAAGRLYSFTKSSLRSLTRKTKFSPMPAYTQLSPTELQDLVAYLASLKGDSAQ
jgi:putative heme-binding domain-containing protein